MRDAAMNQPSLNTGLTAEQVRGARALLHLDEERFASLLHITLETLTQMERSHGPLDLSPEMSHALSGAILQAGVQLIDTGSYVGIGGPGVRLIGEPVATAEVIDLETAQAAQPKEPDAVSA